MKHTLSCLTVLFLGAPPALAADAQFVIVQPGYPGSTSQAETFVSELGAAISKGGGPKGAAGEYHNDTAEALKVIAEKQPAFGIVSLGFYLDHKKDLKLEPLLESRPHQRFCLAAKKGSAVMPADLAGQVVAGTPFQEQEFVTRVVFGPGASGEPVKGDGKGNSGSNSRNGQTKQSGAGAALAPNTDAPAKKGPAAGKASAGGEPLADVRAWKVEATNSFSKGVRDAARGKVAAVLLTDREKQAMAELTAGKEIEVYYQTEEFPTAIVVSFGPAGAATKEAAKAMAKLKDSPEGQQILSTMVMDGFVPVDRDCLSKIEKRYDSAGKNGEPGAGR